MLSLLSTLFFPRSCVGCGQWDEVLCPECRHLLRPPDTAMPPWRLLPIGDEAAPGHLAQHVEVLAQSSEVVVQSAEVLAQSSEVVVQSAEVLARSSEGVVQSAEVLAQSPEGLGQCVEVPHWAVGEYAGPIRRFLLAAKHRADVRLDNELLDVGYRIGQYAANSLVLRATLTGAKCLWVVPAPSRLRRRFRGREVALPLAVGIARGVCERLGIRTEVVEACALRWGAGTQSGRKGEARRRGRVGAMKSRCRVPTDVQILLVDDIVTTGATITEMVRCLGQQPVGVASLCWVTRP